MRAIKAMAKVLKLNGLRWSSPSENKISERLECHHVAEAAIFLGTSVVFSVAHSATFARLAPYVLLMVLLIVLF